MCCVYLSLGSTDLTHYMFDLMLFLSLMSIYISLLSSLKAWNAPTTYSVGRCILLNTFLNWKHLLLTIFQAQFIPTMCYYGEFWNLNYFFKNWSGFLAKGRGVTGEGERRTKTVYAGIPCLSNGWDPMLSLLRAQVQSLVKEIRPWRASQKRILFLFL